ncbi:MAG: transglutaminase domain-containing protein [Candidatus Nezhaarchaeales archaeon]
MREEEEMRSRIEHIILLAAVVFLLAHFFTAHQGVLVSSERSVLAYYRYWYNITLTVQGDVSDVKDINQLVIFPNTTRQTVLLEQALCLIDGKEVARKSLTSDENGNAVLAFDFTPNDLKNGSILTLYFRVTIIQRTVSLEAPIGNIRNASLNEVPSGLTNFYVNNEWPIPGEIYDLSRELAGSFDKVFDVLNAFATWIENNVAYPLSREVRDVIGPQYPNETFQKRVGDCDDSSILFITMCRAVGIPSFLQLGGIPQLSISEEVTAYKGNYIHRSKGIGWHAWSMVFFPGVGWLPVDLTYFSGARLELAYNGTVGYIKSPLGLISRIRFSAYFIANPIIYANFSSLKYVDEARCWEKAMVEGRIKYIGTEELVALISRVSIPIEIPLILACIFLVLVLLTYFKFKAKKVILKETYWITRYVEFVI